MIASKKFMTYWNPAANYNPITEQAKRGEIKYTMTDSLNARLVREQELGLVLSSVGFGTFEKLN